MNQIGAGFGDPEHAADRRAQADSIFEAACVLPHWDRKALLDRRCANDSTLRAALEARLNDHDASRAVLAAGSLPTIDGGDSGGKGGGAPPGHPPIGEQPGDFIGPYKLLSRLGEGGFGVVWLAERREPHVQRVALKIIKPGMDSRTVIARFEAERQALAVMDHPNIAKVFDAGATQAGRPYFVMEHVQGEPITTYCDRHNHTINKRLELFIPVCEAVQHAHMKGIIHRDLKPSNILVIVKEGEASGGPIPKVIDFGVAKAISHTLIDKTIVTEQGQIIGTPDYMSPEQAEMGAIDIDTRADVYSLGVVLYELLTGLLPFDPRKLRSAGYAEIQRIIREVEPAKPSTRLTSLRNPAPTHGSVATINPDRPSAERIAEQRRVRVEELARQLRRELEWIPLMAMRKDRTERYQSASGLAEDVQNYLAGRPLIACPESAVYRLRKFASRHRRPLLAIGSTVLALAVGFLGMAWQARQATAARDESAALNTLILGALGGELHDSMGDLTATQQLRMELPLVRAIAERSRDELAGFPRSLMSIESALANQYARHTAYADAADHAQRAIAAAKLAGDVDRLQFLVLHHECADLYFHAGNTQPACEHARLARNLLDEVVDAPPWLRASTMRNYALALAAEGDLNGAIDVFNREIESIERSGFRAADLASQMVYSLDRLAGTLRQADRQQEAEQVYRRAISIADRSLAPEAMWRGPPRRNLAAMLMSDLAAPRRAAGDQQGAMALYIEAERLLNEALDPRIIKSQVDHNIELLGTRHLLASALFGQGRLAQAETIWRQVLALTREHHPRFTMHRGVFCYAFAELLLASGRLDEAAQLIHESEQHLRGAGATTGRYWDRFESVRNQLSDALGAAAPQ